MIVSSILCTLLKQAIIVVLIIYAILSSKKTVIQHRQLVQLQLLNNRPINHCCFLPRLKVGVQGNVHARISWAYWFKRVLYYQVALVYVLTRLVLNVSQVSTCHFSFSFDQLLVILESEKSSFQKRKKLINFGIKEVYMQALQLLIMYWEYNIVKRK